MNSIESRVIELRAKNFSPEEIRIIVENEVKLEISSRAGNSAKSFQSKDAWRSEPASESQLKLLELNNVRASGPLTKGDATDLIDVKKKELGRVWRWK